MNHPAKPKSAAVKSLRKRDNKPAGTRKSKTTKNTNLGLYPTGSPVTSISGTTQYCAIPVYDPDIPYILGIPVRYLLSIPGEDTHKKLLKNRELVDKIMKREAQDQELAEAELVPGSEGEAWETAVAPVFGTSALAFNHVHATTAMASDNLGPTPVQASQNETVNLDEDSLAGWGDSITVRSGVPPLVPSLEAVDHLDFVELNVIDPMLLGEPHSPSADQTTEASVEQRRHSARSSSPLFFPSSTHHGQKTSSPRRRGSRHGQSSSISAPTPQHSTPPASPQAVTHQPISSHILAMVVSSRTGGGTLPTDPAARLSFSRMDKWDHDRLNRARDNKLAQAACQRPDQHDGVTVEKLGQMKADLRARKLVEVKAARLEEKKAQQEARAAKRRKGPVSTPLNIIGRAQVDAVEGEEYYDYSPISTTNGANGIGLGLSDYEDGEHERDLEPTRKRQRNPDGPTILRNGWKRARQVPVHQQVGPSYLSENSSSPFSDVNAIGMLESLHIRLQHGAEFNKQLIRNSTFPLNAKYVPGTPGWTKLKVELANQMPKPPRLPKAGLAASKSSLGLTHGKHNGNDNDNVQEIEERLATFMQEVVVWEQDLDMRVAAKKQIFYMQRVEEVEALHESIEAAAASVSIGPSLGQPLDIGEMDEDESDEEVGDIPYE